MKRVWWALPTTVLVCTGWLWSVDAADPRLKKKPKLTQNNSAVKTLLSDKTPPASSIRSERVSAEEDESVEEQENESRVNSHSGLMPPDQHDSEPARKGARKPEGNDDENLIDRLLAEEGLVEPKSKIQTVSAEIPEGSTSRFNPLRYSRQRTKARLQPARIANQSDAPEEVTEPNPVSEEQHAPRKTNLHVRQNARLNLNSGFAPIGAVPQRSIEAPAHEEVPAPGIDDIVLPASGTRMRKPISSTHSSPPPIPATISDPSEADETEPRHPATSHAPQTVARPQKFAFQATPIPTDEEVPVPLAPAPAPEAHRSSRQTMNNAAPRTISRASAPRVQTIGHRTSNAPLAEVGELPALRPGAQSRNDADGSTPPPPPSRVRPMQKGPRHVQQTSISTSSPKTQVRLVPATVQTPQAQQTPSINLRWVTDGEVNVGQTCKCGLVVKNSSAIDARNILVEAAFPKSVRIVSAKPEPRLVEDNLIWKFAEFSAGEERTIEITMIPFKRGELATSASVRFTGTASTVLKVEEADLAVTLKGKQDATVGETITHVVSVSNPGTGIAQDVTVHAVIPKGLEHSRGKRIEMNVGTLAAGETRDIRLALAAIAGGDHPVHVEARSGQHLVRRADSVVHVTAPKVTVTASGPTLRYVGRQAQYMVTVSNVGTMATDNVRVQMQVAPGFDFVKAEQNGRYDWNGRAVTWFLGRLEANQTSELPVVLAARQAGTHKHNITVTDEVGGTSSAEVETRVETTSAIVMEVVDLDDPVEVGAQTAYEIRIRNDGTKAAQDVTLSFDVPPGVELVDTQGPTAGRRGKGGVAFKALPSLSPNQRATYRVVVTGREAGNLRFRAKLTSNASPEPLMVEEQTKFYAD